MSSEPTPGTVNVLRRRRKSARILPEALAVALVGLAVALLANQLSPRGLRLGRDYFPTRLATAATNAAATSQGPAKVELPMAKVAPGSTGRELVNPEPEALPDPPSPPARPHESQISNLKSEIPEPPADALAARLQASGLRWIDRAEAMRLFQDPGREEERIVFIDARNDRHYQEGHIPGAYPFDRFYPEIHLPIVLPACQQAERVVVYCNGGDCEDSEFAALALRDAGIPVERLGVYGGGMTDWTGQDMPVEVGSRGSGERREKAP